ncbi:retropepsin-like aspartic protease family protein [Pseudoduganella sp. RAF53_2]|uniref:retropepsin-like aspartic protease family protein n=1 Tax=unclassified Pseudoduganella TaxID=2637179 RepID=UPI003F9BA9E8
MFKTILAAMLALLCGAAYADVNVVGVLKEKALLSVDGAAAKVYPVGATLPDRSKLVAVSSSGVTLEENGKRYTAQLGQFANAPAALVAPNLVFYADPNGHYVVPGEINGVPTRMMVDTGATMLSIPGFEARRMGIDFRLKGKRGFAKTAGGLQETWLVKVDKLKVADTEISNIEAVIMDGGLPMVLLGNNFLNHFEMRRDGTTMTLTRKN